MKNHHHQQAETRSKHARLTQKVSAYLVLLSLSLFILTPIIHSPIVHSPIVHAPTVQHNLAQLQNQLNGAKNTIKSSPAPVQHTNESHCPYCQLSRTNSLPSSDEAKFQATLFIVSQIKHKPDYHFFVLSRYHYTNNPPRAPPVHLS